MGRGWTPPASAAFLAVVLAAVLLTDASVTVRDTDITTRGKTFRVVCSVKDEAFDGWYRNNVKVTAFVFGDQLAQSRLYVSENGDEHTLVIQNVKVADGGTFQCRGGKTVTNFTLFVEFYSLEFPKSQELDAGKNTTLKCAADGYPYPTFKWYKNFKRIDLRNPRYTLLKNGSLALTNVREDDAGNYTCLITQLGEVERQREERKDIQVVVFAPPRIDLSLSTAVVYSYTGNPHQLAIRCHFWGYPIPKLKIRRNNKALSSNQVERDSERSIKGFVLTSKDSDFGKYMCEAENERGKASHAVEVKRAGRPSPPQNITVKRSCDHLTVSWSEPEDDGGIEVAHYTLELEQENRMLHTVIVGSVTLRYTFTRGIRPKTTYALRIKANSEARDGRWANATVVSGVCRPTGAMRITNEQRWISSTGFTLQWTKPADGGDPNINYTVEYSKRDSEGNFVLWRKRTGLTQQEYRLGRLVGGAEYEFRVTAVNSAGHGDAQAVKRFSVMDDGSVLPTPGGLDTIYGIEINCTSPNIYLNFNMKDSASFAKESFNLRDSSCVPYVMTPTKVLVKTRLDTCGTTSTHANDTVTYHNSLLVKVNGIRETERIEFPFSCTFGKQSEIGTPSFQTRQRLMLYRVKGLTLKYLQCEALTTCADLLTSAAGVGNFTFLMSLYKDNEYRAPYHVWEYPVTVYPSSTLYGQAELTASDGELVMLLTTCSATPTMSPDDPIRYPFIEGGCPADGSVAYPYQHSPVQRFQLEAFRFKQESKFIYLHCEVLVCHQANNSRCLRGCQRTKRRSLETDGKVAHSVTLGPIHLESNQKRVSRSEHGAEFDGSLGLLLLGMFGALVGPCVIFVAVIYILRKFIGEPEAPPPSPQKV